MNVRELIKVLGEFDGDLPVMGLVDDQGMYADVPPPVEVEVVKGNMVLSYGTEWVPKENIEYTRRTGKTIAATDEMKAVRIF